MSATTTRQDLTAADLALLATLPHAELMDVRTGIVRSLQRSSSPDHFPAGFDLYTATLSDTTRFAGWAADPAGAGYAFADPRAALGAALGEAAERYCGNATPPDLPAGSAEDMRRKGERVIDLTSLALFSAEQLASPGFPAAALTDDLAIEWARAEDDEGDQVLVPASLVWPSYISGRSRDWPVTNPVIQAGLAAGQSRAAAVRAGLREIIERDAMAMTWLGSEAIAEVSVPPWLQHMGRGPRGLLRTRWLHLQSPFGSPVIATLVEDETSGYLSMGVAVGNAPEAALKALAEALQLQLVLADYDDPRTALGASGARRESPLKSWRRDRRYGSTYRPDRTDVVDYACHLQLHLDPAVQEAFQERLRQRLESTVALGDLTVSEDPTEAFLRQDLHPLIIDLTTSDVRTLGLHVVRVLVPGTYSNSPLGLPFLGGARLTCRPGDVPTVPWPH